MKMEVMAANDQEVFLGAVLTKYQKRKAQRDATIAKFKAARRGAPSVYSEDLADLICNEIALGKSLVTICNETPVDYTSVCEWLQDERKTTFAKKYAQARESQAEYLADEIVRISDESGLETRYDPVLGRIVVDGEAIQRAKLRVDTRKWVASKLKPKKYGDGLTLRGDKENPLFDLASQMDAAREKLNQYIPNSAPMIDITPSPVENFDQPVSLDDLL